MRRHRGAQLGRMPAESDSRVIWHVEPLVGVEGPRVGVREPLNQMAASWRGERPQTEGAVHVNPGASLARSRAQLRSGIEGAGIHVSSLQAVNGTDIERGQRRGP